MRKLSAQDLECLAIGSAMLGSGGGGDPKYALQMALYQLELYGPATLISVDELKDDDVVVPLGIMGAPFVNIERLVNGVELETLITTIVTKIGKKPTVLMAGEIGGSNAFAPFLIAAKLGLPILDADLIGRAFPKLEMNSCHLLSLTPEPAVIADCLGNAVILTTPDLWVLEAEARELCVRMGSSAAIALHIMDGSLAKTAVVQGTVSQAIDIGIKIRTDSFEALNDARVLGKGRLVDIEQEVRDGFLFGSVTLKGSTSIEICYQNEYLMAFDGDQAIAATPEIIMLLEESSGALITSESLRYGVEAVLIALPAPAIWKTEKGLALVGPEVFGYKGVMV